MENNSAYLVLRLLCFVGLMSVIVSNVRSLSSDNLLKSVPTGMSSNQPAWLSHCDGYGGLERFNNENLYCKNGQIISR